MKLGAHREAKDAAGWKSRRVMLGVAALLAAHYVLAVSAAFQKSITFDEQMHLAQGCLRWLQPECGFPAMNGVVAQRLAALPSVLAGVNVPDMQAAPWRDLDQAHQARAIYYESGNDFIAMLHRGRATVALLSVACGLLCFLWAREIFGAAGGFLSLTLYAFSPMTLANGPLITADTAAALLFLGATFSFWKMTHRVTWPHVTASGTALTLLVLAKTSGVLVAPILALIALVRVGSGPDVLVHLRGWPRSALHRPGERSLGLLALLALHVAVLIPALWLGYDFATLGPDLAPVTAKMLRSPEFSIASISGMKIWLIETIAALGFFPHAFSEGLRMTAVATELTPAFLAGRYSMEGFAGFFPFAFVVKSPVGALALLCSGLLAGILACRSRGLSLLYAVAPLFILLGVYGAFAITSRMNIGIRHILPLYAPLFILCGANVHWLRAGRAGMRWGVIAMGASAVFAGLASYPHYLAFFNLPSGGSARGYRLLADSSIDWGQDLPTLKRWLDRHRRPEDAVYLSYFGTGLPEFHGIEALGLPRHFDWARRDMPPLRGGIYCISATMLTNLYSPFLGPWCEPFEDEYQKTRAALNAMEARTVDPAARIRLMEQEGREAWEMRLSIFRQLRFLRLCAALRQRTPDDDAGHSILIYRLTDEEVTRALEGPPAELHAKRVAEPEM